MKHNHDLAVIGAGRWGSNLIRDFHQIGCLYAICETDKEKHSSLKEQYPEVYVTDPWINILSDFNVKKIVIALPAEMHYKYCKDALQHLKDVYVEKPLSLNIKDGDELVNMAKRNNKILMVGHLLQYHHCIEKIYQMIKDNAIGKIRYINSNRMNLGQFRQEENVLWSFAPHDISVILRLMNNELPNTVISHGYTFITKNIHDVTTTIMEFADDTYCQINVNWISPNKDQTLTIVGTHGMIVFDDCRSEKITYYSEYIDWQKSKPLPIKSNGVVVPISQKPNHKHQLTPSSNHLHSNTPLYRECQHFLECCRSRRLPKTDGNEGLRVLRILDACQRSLELGGEKITLSSSSSSVSSVSSVSSATSRLLPSDNGKNNHINRHGSFFCHPSSIIDTGANIGNGTKIWHFSHLMKCQIGMNCTIGQNVFIGDNVKIGDGCKVQNNVSLYDGVTAGNYVFFGPSCVFTNDLIPNAQQSKNKCYQKTVIEDNVSIGANATILCGIKLGKGCMIGAGSVVTKDVEPYTVVIGNPAKFHKRLVNS